MHHSGYRCQRCSYDRRLSRPPDRQNSTELNTWKRLPSVFWHIPNIRPTPGKKIRKNWILSCIANGDEREGDFSPDMLRNHFNRTIKLLFGLGKKERTTWTAPNSHTVCKSSWSSSTTERVLNEWMNDARIDLSPPQIVRKRKTYEWYGKTTTTSAPSSWKLLRTK